MNRENLEKLGRYLANLSPSYQREHFNMRVFATHNGLSLEPRQIRDELTSHICGTAACAIGHIPVVFPDEFRKNRNKHWWALAYKILGVTSEWLFAATWGRSKVPFNRTSWAVADRIACTLERNGTPSQWISWGEENELRPDWSGAAVRAGWVTPARRKYQRSTLKEFA
jgi:hypothetical protein